ncbi:glycosyl hydrolase family 28 protein [Echinicola jeungdonensis]|uniref:Glycosyl hydrolase family 28 protein n=1 Tax=Echinicola jeungdonensis TaxID=709343 RepID=A0ABV5JBG3_9BACT|nr:glycosyl hydrolase family 28 protein [Echinicola jeungdonensis]MDN3670443.1 glycosyl hydrolase family 28 protein [Echinicola jeungdonensis]
MMKKLSYIAMLMALMSIVIKEASAQDSLVTYDVPKALFYSMHNDDFTVQVRNPGGQWIDIYEYKVKVDMDNNADASMVYFDFSGRVEVKIRKNNGNVGTVAIRPLSYGIIPEVNGNIIQFTLDKPRNISLEVNGDKLHNLHLFAQTVEESRPDPNDPNVVYFGPGVHEAPDKPGKVFQIKSGQTVYIHGAAAIKGKLLCDKVKDVRIIGRGMILHPERGVEIRHSENIEIDGIHVVNPKHYTVYGGQSNEIKIKNITSFSCGPWTDGIDLMSCSDVEIDGVFLRTSDDCIAIYAHRWDFYGNAKNYKITNSTLWADVAHPTNIGAHGNTEHEGDTIENITFSNIDILEHDEDDPCCVGTMAIIAADNNLVRNVTYENIRIEDIQEGRLFDLRVHNDPKYNTKSGRSIENIYFKNITYNGSGLRPSQIKGYNEERNVNGVTIENVRINGEKVTNAQEADLIIGDFVKNVKFKK